MPRGWWKLGIEMCAPRDFIENARQINGESGSLIRFAFDRDLAPSCGNETLASRQSQSCAMTFWFRREEGLKKPRLYGGIHAGTGIRNAKVAKPGGVLKIQFAGFLISQNPCGNVDPTFDWDGVAGVQDKINENLGDVILVGLDLKAFFACRNTDLNRLGNEPMEHETGFLHQIIEGDERGLANISTAKK